MRARVQEVDVEPRAGAVTAWARDDWLCDYVVDFGTLQKIGEPLAGKLFN
jgi:hypothetical protein